MRTALVLAVTLALLGTALAKPPGEMKKPPAEMKKPPAEMKKPPGSPKERLLQLLQSSKLVEALKKYGDDLSDKSPHSDSNSDESVSGSGSGSGFGSGFGSGSGSGFGSGFGSGSGSAIDSMAGSFKSLSSEGWVDYFKETCGMSDDWPNTDGPLTPELLRGEVGDLEGFVNQARDAAVGHRGEAETLAGVLAGAGPVGDLTDWEFWTIVNQHADMFDNFMATMDELSQGSMCTMMRVAHLRDRFEFEGDEGFAREDSCRDSHFLVNDAEDLAAAVADRQFIADFGNAMTSDIQCAGDEIENFAQRIFSDYLVEADLATLTRRDVAERFSFIEQFLETAGREVYEFAEAVHSVGDAIGDMYARALHIKENESKIDRLGAMIKALEAAFASKH